MRSEVRYCSMHYIDPNLIARHTVVRGSSVLLHLSPWSDLSSLRRVELWVKRAEPREKETPKAEGTSRCTTNAQDRILYFVPT